MGNLILVKIGGSLITDKTKSCKVNMKTMKRIAKEVHEARKKKKIKIVLGHGAGSFGHIHAKKYKTHSGFVNKKSYMGMAVVQHTVSRLNRIFVKTLIEAGENAISIHPSSCCYTNNGEIVDWCVRPIKLMLKADMLPVPHGDVVFDVKKGCSIVSTEKIINILPKIVKPRKIIIVGEVDGVFTGDPYKNPKAKLIPLITTKSFKKIRRCLKGSRGIDVTGGMLHKVEEMLKLAKKGFIIEIINGKKPGRLRDALLGKKVIGTTIRK